MYYEIPKDTVVDDHEVYAYLCGTEELAKAIQECLNSGSSTIKLKYFLESWEQDGDRICIKYKKICIKKFEVNGIKVEEHEVLLYDSVPINTVFNDKVNYIDLLSRWEYDNAPEIKSEMKATSPESISVEGLLTNLNRQLQTLCCQIEGLKGVIVTANTPDPHGNIPPLGLLPPKFIN